jgi:2-polyprenyl-3-methyl-5-hydroxy-6-metoxy-1,4-benzoquinol methylase
MKFTPELLAAVNSTYDLEQLQKALEGKEEFLTYSRCMKCGMIFCENLWDDSTLNNVYQNAIDHNKSRNKILSIDKRLMLMSTWNNILRIFRLLGKNRLNNIKLIDYGCGWGDFLDAAYGYGIDGLGYDKDIEKIKLAEMRGHKIAKSIDQLKDYGPVDVIVMNSVLEHIQDVEGTFDLISQVLVPEGLLVLSVMDYRNKYIEKNINMLKSGLPALTKNLNPVEHVNVYNYKTVILTLKRYNFSFLSTRHILCLTDNFLARNNIFLVNFFNKIEWLSTKIVTGKEIGIAVYALNQR